MNSNLVLFFCAVFVVGSVTLMATTSSLSDSFKVYAANNCDASSICINNPGSDTQLNNCTRLSTCLNSDFASLNTQNNNCSDGSFCANNALGNSNTQNLNCARVFQCVNNELGSSGIKIRRVQIQVLFALLLVPGLVKTRRVSQLVHVET